MKIICLIAMLLLVASCQLFENDSDFEYEFGDATIMIIEGCAKEREKAISEALAEHLEGKIPDICKKLDEAIQKYNE